MAGKVPFELRVALREGSIFYFQNRHHTSAEPHFHIVVNADPLGTALLILTVVTSQIQNVKRRNASCPECIVELAPSDLPGILTKASVVDCNILDAIPLAEFCERWEAKEVKSFGKDLPPPLRRALRAAIHASTQVAEELRAFVAKP